MRKRNKSTRNMTNTSTNKTKRTKISSLQRDTPSPLPLQISSYWFWCRSHCSSLMIIMIMTFINQYNKTLYHYTNLALHKFWCKKSYILFAYSEITSTPKSKFREPPLEIWGAENMSLLSHDWVLYMIFSVRLCTTHENWGYLPFR